jgi:hypothetical protein
VLDVQEGTARITAYKQWRAADMNERVEFYLTKKWSPQATLPNIPPSWLGRAVSLDRDHIKGELVGVDDDAVLLKSDWSSGRPPRVKRYSALWVTAGSKPFRKLPAKYQQEKFLAAGASHGVFYAHTTSADLVSGEPLSGCIQPVAIVELGVSEETGEVSCICMYGAPIFEEGWGSRPWNIRTKWCQTHHEAQLLQEAFKARLNNLTDESEVEALRRRLEFEKERPDAIVWS